MRVLESAYQSFGERTEKLLCGYQWEYTSFLKILFKKKKKKEPHQFQSPASDILDSTPEKCGKQSILMPACRRRDKQLWPVLQKDTLFRGKNPATVWRESPHVSHSMGLAGFSFQPALGQAGYGSTASCQSSSQLQRWVSAQPADCAHSLQKAMAQQMLLLSPVPRMQTAC